VNMPTSLTQKK